MQRPGSVNQRPNPSISAFTSRLSSAESSSNLNSSNMYPYLQSGGPRMMGSYPNLQQGPTGSAGAFPFGSSGASNTPGAASLASQLANLSGQALGQSQAQGQGGELNLNDFPALGAGQQGGQGQGGAPGLGGMGSYASQAGTPGAATSLRGGAPLRNFTQDDFPALNQGSRPGDGRNGEDLFPHGAAEQASAAAALQHQHQHRQNLMGSAVGGTRTDSARGGFGDPYATKVGSGQQQTWNPPGGLFDNLSGSAQLNGVQRASSPSSARSPLSSIRNVSSGLNNASSADTASSRADGTSSGNPPGLMGQGGAMAQTPAQQILTSPADRFGLLGLLSMIKSADPDMSMLSMGLDLQTFGLNLNSSDPLYSSFITPWSENNALAASRVEPEFTLPSCYNVQPPPPAQSKIASFSDETLFFIFYSTPRDLLQEVAAQELYARNWRYHKELHLWLTKEQNTEPTHKTPTYERGTYVFFDPASWEKVSKSFVLMYEMLEEKVPTQAQALAAQAAAATLQQQQRQGQSHQQHGQQQQPSPSAASSLTQ